MGNPLAIDVGEWFHDAALRDHLSARHWRRLASCSELALSRLRGASERKGRRATWFVTGELAARAPAALRELAAAGHEIALSAAPLATTAAPDADECERAARVWTAALAAIEAATGQAVLGVRLPLPAYGMAATWWRSWFAQARLAYAITGADGEAAAVARLSGGSPVAAALVAAWRFVPEQPRLVGLPSTVFAAHYLGLSADPGSLAVALADADGTVASRLGIVATASVPRPLSAPPSVVAAPGAPRLAIVVPLKDEAAGIASLAVELAEVRRALADVAACEFVFVDDGSSDDTWSLLQQHFAGWSRATFVRHEHNQGVAAAIRSGLLATDAPLCASIDGDLSYDPMELRAMLAMAADADVVTASPYHPRGGVKNVPGWRLLLSRTLSSCYRVLLRSPVRTWTSCFRVYRRAAVADLPLANPGFLGTAELLARVLRRGGRVVEHPCVLEARLFGFSKMKVARTILGHLRLLVAVALRRVR